MKQIFVVEEKVALDSNPSSAPEKVSVVLALLGPKFPHPSNKTVFMISSPLSSLKWWGSLKGIF